MTESDLDGAKASLEAAVRSFTEAEVALGEFVAAAQRFRSAAESLNAAQAGLESLNDATLAAVEVQKAMAENLQETSKSLTDASAIFAALDPERFWSAFADLETSTNLMVSEHKAGLEEQRREFGETRAAISNFEGAANVTAEEHKRAFEELGRQIGEAHRLVSSVRIGVLVAVTIGLITLGFAIFQVLSA